MYTGDPVYYEKIPDIIKTHRTIRDSGCPNFLKCRIPVTSNLKIENWRLYLDKYWDQQIVDLLQYSFPLDFDRQCQLVSTEVNHASAIQNSDHVQQYLQEELTHRAILGPFTQPPFSVHVSPLMVRDKQDSDQKRMIMDLSWPKGLSLNNGVTKDMYLDTPYTLHYPSIDNITAALSKLGPGAHLFKIDISRAFRQIKIDPGDIDLLGMKFQGQYFIDLSVAFGYRHGSKIFQHCTDAIRHIMTVNGFPNLFNYIDDLVYTGLPSNIHQAFDFLNLLLADLVMDISYKKLVSPDTAVTCLGILINTIDKTIAIPAKKLQEITNICNNWSTRTYCSKRDLQSLLGSLLYITKCVKPARSFLNRMLQLLRDNFHNSKILLSQEFFRDLAWFRVFLSQYNCVTYYDHTFYRIPVHLDACLTGLGGKFRSMVYALPRPLGFKGYSIVHLEILNIVVAAKIWASHWGEKKFKFFATIWQLLTSSTQVKPEIQHWQLVPEIHG